MNVFSFSKLNLVESAMLLINCWNETLGNSGMSINKQANWQWLILILATEANKTTHCETSRWKMSMLKNNTCTPFLFSLNMAGVWAHWRKAEQRVKSQRVHAQAGTVGCEGQTEKEQETLGGQEKNFKETKILWIYQRCERMTLPSGSKASSGCDSPVRDWRVKLSM